MVVHLVHVLQVGLVVGGWSRLLLGSSIFVPGSGSMLDSFFEAVPAMSVWVRFTSNFHGNAFSLHLLLLAAQAIIVIFVHH